MRKNISRPMAWFVGGLLLATVLLPTGCGCGKKTDPPPRQVEDITTNFGKVLMLGFDENGVLKNDQKLKEIGTTLKTDKVTDVFVMAHGWNTSLTDAVNLYKEMSELADQVGKTDAVKKHLTKDYKPVVIGMSWPSKAWDNTRVTAVSMSAQKRLSKKQADILKEIFMEAGAEKAVAEKDVATIVKLDKKPRADLKPEDWQTLVKIFRKYAIPRNKLKITNHAHKSPFDKDVNMQLQPRMIQGMSVGDLARVFTFWQMKQRAGLVGENGGRVMLDHIQEAAPSAKIHLFGHSFGAKVVLSAVVAKGKHDPVKPVHTVVLIQPAISHLAFAETVPDENRPGGYRPALDIVKGPIIATFTKNDWELRVAYPLGAGLAGSTGEIGPLSMAANKYSAMGAVGIDKADRVDMQSEGGRYNFAADSKLYSIASDQFIKGHSALRNREVVWLTWASVLRR